MNLKELSDLLDLSPTTNSRELNDSPEVSQATRQRVLTAAASAGNQPNQNAQRLAAGRANATAVVWTSSRDPLERHLEAHLLRCLTEASSQLDIHLVSVPAGYDNGPTRIRSLFSKGSINAALFVNPIELPAILDLPFPSLVFGRRPAIVPGLSSVDIDYRATSARAAEFLFQFGHRHIAVVDNQSSPSTEMANGADDAASVSRILPRPVVHRVKSLAASQIINEGDHPTAFLCPGLHCAADLVAQARSKGLVIGSDISIAAFDSSYYGEMSRNQTPQFTVLRLNLECSAKTILSALREALAARSRESRSPLFPDLFLGETTGAPTLLSSDRFAPTKQPNTSGNL